MLHNIIAMYSTLACNNWTELLLFVQFAHNTAYSSTLGEATHYLAFARAAVLRVDLILGVPATTQPQSQLDYSRRTVKTLQLVYEAARRNLKERADKQAMTNEKLSFPSFKTDEQVFINRPYNETDIPNRKLYSPWHGPYFAFPVIYRVTKYIATTETIVHLGRMKKYDVQASP